MKVDVPPRSGTPLRLVTAEEAAALLRLSPQTVRGLLRRGDIHGVRIGSGPKATWRIPVGELQRLCGDDVGAA